MQNRLSRATAEIDDHAAAAARPRQGVEQHGGGVASENAEAGVVDMGEVLAVASAPGIVFKKPCQ